MSGRSQELQEFRRGGSVSVPVSALFAVVTDALPWALT